MEKGLAGSQEAAIFVFPEIIEAGIFFEISPQQGRESIGGSAGNSRYRHGVIDCPGGYQQQGMLDIV